MSKVTVGIRRRKNIKHATAAAVAAIAAKFARSQRGRLSEQQRVSKRERVGHRLKEVQPVKGRMTRSASGWYFKTEKDE